MLEKYDGSSAITQAIPNTFIYSEDFNVISVIAEEISTLTRSENNPTGIYTTEGENFTSGFRIDSHEVLDKTIHVLNIPVCTGLLSYPEANLSQTQLLARMIKKNDFMESFLIGHAKADKYVIVNMELVNLTEEEDKEESLVVLYRPTRIKKMTNGYPLIAEDKQEHYTMFFERGNYQLIAEDYLLGADNKTVLDLLDI